MQVGLNAFDRDSSASFSELVVVNSKEELRKATDDFVEKVPFLRWYPDHTNESGEDALSDWLNELGY